MSNAIGITRIAALLSDPTRSLMLSTLMDGRAFTVSELARSANVALPTASGHLAKLHAEHLVCAEKQGRHRYFRLANADVAAVIESMMSLAVRRLAPPAIPTGPTDALLRRARVCYDHLAGERGVQLLEGLKRRGSIIGESELVVTAAGALFFEEFGIDLAALRQKRRPLCKCCLDWSERRSHLAGSLGAALFVRLQELHWIKHGPARAMQVTPLGIDGFERYFG